MSGTRGARRPKGVLLPFLLIAALAIPVVPVSARADDQPKKDEPSKKTGLIQCTMDFNLKGWSAFYKTSKGDGTITCDNGQSMKVTIKATGGGLSFGKSEVLDGKGNFSGAKSLDELLGAYVQSQAGAGAGKQAEAQALTKGEVSLTLHGTGRGVEIGFSFGKFTIEKAGASSPDDAKK